MGLNCHSSPPLKEPGKKTPFIRLPGAIGEVGAIRAESRLAGLCLHHFLVGSIGGVGNVNIISAPGWVENREDNASGNFCFTPGQGLIAGSVFGQRHRGGCRFGGRGSCGSDGWLSGCTVGSSVASASTVASTMAVGVAVEPEPK